MSYDLDRDDLREAVVEGNVDYIWSAYQQLQQERDEAYEKLDKLSPVAASITICGMYDCHMFHFFDGKSPEQIIEQWKVHRHPEYGLTALCPVIVLDKNDKQLRRVGEMVMENQNPSKWLAAVKSDTDIMYLLTLPRKH